MTNTTTNQPQVVFDVQADDMGNWQTQIPNDLPAGVHTVVITSDDGQSRNIAMYSLQKETHTVSNTLKEIPWGIVYPLLFLLVIILVLALNNLRLVNVNKNKKNIIQLWAVALTVLTVIFSCVLVGYLAWDVKKMNYVNPMSDINRTQLKNAATINQLSGTVIDPWSGIPVGGAKLKLGDVTITTQEGGRFNFSSVPSDGRIRLSHASLTKDVLMQVGPDGNGLMDVYFEPKTYNALIEVLHHEAVGDLSAIYAQLPDVMRSKIKESDFAGSYVKTAEKSEFLNDDLVVISAQVKDEYIDNVNQLTYSRVLILNVELASRTNKYILVYENGSYKVFKQ